jgi:small subunit ribosomal protein S3
MIKRDFIAQKKKEFHVQEMIASNVRGSGYSHTKIQRTPLGEKIIIHAARPGLVVGRKGQNITKLTRELKNTFELDNPQIEISEIEKMNLDAQVVAGSIAESLERYGSSRFKGVMHKTMDEVMNSGALGVEIVISGKIPGARAKSWRVYSGYLKKCGDIAITGVSKASVRAVLKTGVVGVKVSIMPPDIKLPDNIQLVDELQKEEGEVKREENKEKQEPKEEDKKEDKKEAPKKENQSEEKGSKEETKENEEVKEKNKEEKKKKIKKKASKKTEQKNKVKKE